MVLGRWRRHPVLAIGTRQPVGVKSFFAVPRYPGAVPTARRILNLYRSRWETFRLRETLRSYPIKLTVEPTNACHLRCPACLTGAGERGRSARPLRMDLLERLLDEIGGHLFQVEFTNWGEPLLAKEFPALVQAAVRRGLSTTTSSSLSLPMDRERAEALVASGLHVLGVSIDGTRQESYQAYRVRGDLETVLGNCRLINDAKRRLRSTTPALVWEFHVFPHNVGDVEQARAMAAELGMEITVSKGWVVGPEWKSADDVQFYLGNPEVFPCLFLWQQAVVNNDGGVAPCCGAFYQDDDMGRLAAGGEDGAARSFREVWNGPRFREARRFYRGREGASAAERSRICYECPTTVLWEQWRTHLAADRDPRAFSVGFTFNDGFNYFWNRRPGRTDP
jgi:organic radical activating enzyme